MFAIPVQQINAHTVNSLASRALVNLARSPLRLAILQRLQILFIEEQSLLSAEMLATMDMILRYIKCCDRFPAQDADLQQVITILRTVQPTEAQIQQARTSYRSMVKIRKGA